MSETTKQAVLAKCQELYRMGERNERGFASRLSFGCYILENEGKTVQYTVWDELPATDGAWALAATILGVEVIKTLPQAIADIANDTLGLPRVFMDSAQIEIAKAKEVARPSDALLWEAFQEAKSVDYLAYGHLVAKQAKEKNREQFERWLATLPPDHLEGDRALVAEVVTPMIGKHGQFQIRTESAVFESILRLCGKGVERG